MRLYLCGAGNSEGIRLALRINQEQSRWDEMMLLDDDASKHGRSILGVEVVGPFAMLEHADPETTEVANLVARTTARRLTARRKIESYGLPFARLIDPNVDTAGVEFGRDVIVYQNAVVGPLVSVDEGSVVFIGAIVGHGSRLGRCCVVGPNAVINARVQLEEGVYVGTNATILPEVKVGAWATIGAGSVAIQDVPTGATAIGVPAEILMTPKGRTDDEALFAAVGGNGGRVEKYVPPRTAVEEVIAGMWAKVLGVERVGIFDSFFKLGGNSLSAVEITSRLRDVFKVALSPYSIFEAATVAELSQIVIAKETKAGQSEKIARLIRTIVDMSPETAKAMLTERKSGR